MTDLEAEVQQLLAQKRKSVIRQLTAAGVAVVATAGVAYSLVSFFMLLDWGRDSFLGVLLGPPLAWFVYPVVAWRPFRLKHLFIAAGPIVFATLATAAVLLSPFGQKGLTASPALDWVVIYAIAGVAVFEAATVVRNKDIGRLRA